MVPMGIGTSAPSVAASHGGRLLGWAASPVALRRLAVASVTVNVLIVVTGGAVRLTDSGLGCPTWPRCSGSSLVPTDQLSAHKAIEFANRSLTFVVAAVLLLTLVAAWRQRRERGLAILALAGIPMQAVLGGIVVLTDLNPWLVAAHFLLSAAIIAVTFLFWWRVSEQHTIAVPVGALALARVAAATAALVLAIGTVVTGSGPHAGDLHQGRLHRIHLAVSGVSQLHADAVMVLVGTTIGLVALSYATPAAAALRRPAWLLLAIELGQGVIGYTQYFLDVPRGLVAVHMLGACLVWLAALNVLFRVQPRSVLAAAAQE